MKFQLIIEVDYDLNGETPDNVAQQLGYAAMYLSNEGMLSGATDAEVDTWDHEVKINVTPSWARELAHDDMLKAFDLAWSDPCPETNQTLLECLQEYKRFL